MSSDNKENSPLGLVARKTRSLLLLNTDDNFSLKRPDVLQPIPIITRVKTNNISMSPTLQSFKLTDIHRRPIPLLSKFHDIGVISLEHANIELAIQLLEEIVPKIHFTLPLLQKWVDYNYSTTLLPFFYKFSVKEICDFLIIKSNEAWIQAYPSKGSFPKDGQDHLKLVFISHFNKLLTALSSVLNNSHIPRYFRSFFALKCVDLCKHLLNRRHISTTIVLLLSLEFMDESLLLPFCNMPTEKGSSALMLFHLLHEPLSFTPTKTSSIVFFKKRDTVPSSESVSGVAPYSELLKDVDYDRMSVYWNVVFN